MTAGRGHAPLRRAFLDLAAFQLVWLACAIGAGHGWSSPGIASALLLVAVHLAQAPSPHRGRAMYMVLAAAALGFVAESLLLANGLMRYSAPWPTDVLAPAWMVALWAAFGTTIETTRRLLGARPLSKSALLGAVFGPLAYLAGERLGALVFPGGAWPSVLAVAVIWALALPALVALQARRRVDGPPFGI